MSGPRPDPPTGPGLPDPAAPSTASYLDPAIPETVAQGENPTPPAPDPSAPVVVGYEVGELIGDGGMGTVYRARDLLLGRPVALKVLHRTRAEDRARFLAETEVAAAVDHPCVVRMFASGETGGRAYLAMELCLGGTLSDRLRSRPMPPPEAAALLAEVARGVTAIHAQGIVHRDLKPSNILFDDRGRPKVADFGVAKRAASDATRTLSVMGTPAYMAPEQARGHAKSAGPQADVWALGVVLYECLTGTRPFDDPDTWVVLDQVLHKTPTPPRALAPAVPSDLERICQKCLEKNPARRYASAKELAEDLNAFLAGEHAPTVSGTTASRSCRWARQWLFPFGLATADGGPDRPSSGSDRMIESSAVTGMKPVEERPNGFDPRPRANRSRGCTITVTVSLAVLLAVGGIGIYSLTVDRTSMTGGGGDVAQLADRLAWDAERFIDRGQFDDARRTIAELDLTDKAGAERIRARLAEAETRKSVAVLVGQIEQLLTESRLTEGRELLAELEGRDRGAADAIRPRFAQARDAFVDKLGREIRELDRMATAANKGRFEELHSQLAALDPVKAAAAREWWDAPHKKAVHPTADGRLAVARKHFQAGKWADGLVELEDILADELPDLPAAIRGEVYGAAGWLGFDAGHKAYGAARKSAWQVSRPILTKALRLAPNHPKAWHWQFALGVATRHYWEWMVQEGMRTDAEKAELANDHVRAANLVRTAEYQAFTAFSSSDPAEKAVAKMFYAERTGHYRGCKEVLDAAVKNPVLAGGPEAPLWRLTVAEMEFAIPAKPFMSAAQKKRADQLADEAEQSLDKIEDAQLRETAKAIIKRVREYKSE